MSDAASRLKKKLDKRNPSDVEENERRRSEEESRKDPRRYKDALGETFNEFTREGKKFNAAVRPSSDEELSLERNDMEEGDLREPALNLQGDYSKDDIKAELKMFLQEPKMKAKLEKVDIDTASKKYAKLRDMMKKKGK